MLNHHIKCKLLGQDPSPVGSNGWVRFVDCMGDDYSIVEAARQSYGSDKPTYRQRIIEISNLYPEYSPKCVDVLSANEDKFIFIKDNGSTSIQLTLEEAFRHMSGYKGMISNLSKYQKDDERLLRRLMRDFHTSPYEQVELSVQIQCPVHVARQIFRHRMASPNEYSMRYKEAIDDMETTSPEEWRIQSKANKQGSEEEYLPLTEGTYLSNQEKELQEYSKKVYQERLSRGVSREQARKDLPLSNYTRFTWKMDIHNMLHLHRLRLDKHAQKEVRQFASKIFEMVVELYPMVSQAFIDYRMGAISLSVFEIQMLRDCIDYKIYDPSDLMTKAEIEDFEKKLDYIHNFELDKARDFRTYLTN